MYAKDELICIQIQKTLIIYQKYKAIKSNHY